MSAVDTIRAPEAGAQSSIRLHLIVGLSVVAVLVVGLGGWASTAEISAHIDCAQILHRSRFVLVGRKGISGWVENVFAFGVSRELSGRRVVENNLAAPDFPAFANLG